MSRRSLRYYWPSYRALAPVFSNWRLIAWRHYRRQDCEQAIFRNGRVFRMSEGVAGLADLVVEIWGAECYTSNNFYRPSAEDFIVDLGANVGAFSLWAAMTAPGVKVIAVEPSKTNLRAFRRNLEGWPHAIDIRPVAVSGSRGTGHFVEVGRGLDFRLATPNDEGYPAADRVDIVTLADVIASGPKREVDLLKVDIEGAEQPLFAAVSDETLRVVKRISLEYHDNLVPGALATVKAAIARTHDVVACEGSAQGYGLLHAVRRAVPPHSTASAERVR